MTEPHQRLVSPMILAQRLAYEDEEMWSEIETAYGGGGYRIDREKLAELIAKLIRNERRLSESELPGSPRAETA